jgi:hypothetical protein
MGRGKKDFTADTRRARRKSRDEERNFSLLSGRKAIP